MQTNLPKNEWISKNKNFEKLKKLKKNEKTSKKWKNFEKMKKNRKNSKKLRFICYKNFRFFLEIFNFFFGNFQFFFGNFHKFVIQDIFGDFYWIFKVHLFGFLGVFSALCPYLFLKAFRNLFEQRNEKQQGQN